MRFILFFNLILKIQDMKLQTKNISTPNSPLSTPNSPLSTLKNKTERMIIYA